MQPSCVNTSWLLKALDGRLHWRVQGAVRLKALHHIVCRRPCCCCCCARFCFTATLSEYESDVEALDDLLHWLVEGAVRLRALLADTAGGIGVAADSWTIPAGIMPPFPEKSSFGQVGIYGHCQVGLISKSLNHLGGTSHILD